MTSPAVSSAAACYLSAVMFGRGAAVAARQRGNLLGHAGYAALLRAHRAADWPVPATAGVPGSFLGWEKKGTETR